MGFRTLAIQQRSGEVWELLASVRGEFGKFGEALDKARRQLNAAASSIEETGRRTRVLRRRLDAVEHLANMTNFQLCGEENVEASESEDRADS